MPTNIENRFNKSSDINTSKKFYKHPIKLDKSC